MSKFIFLKSLQTILTPLKRLIDRKAENVNWNENDSTSNSYIAGRTHYKEKKEVYHVRNQQLSFSGDSNGIYSAETSVLNGTVGDVFTVVWDGAEYECEVALLSGAYTLGNHSIISALLGEELIDTGEPFLWAFIPTDGYSIIYTFDTAESHVVSCSEMNTVVHKIPSEYLDINIESATYDTAGIVKLSNPYEIDYRDYAGSIGVNSDGQLIPVIHPLQDNIFKDTISYYTNRTFSYWATQYNTYWDLSDKMSSKKCIFGFNKIANGYLQIDGQGGEFSWSAKKFVCDVLEENGVKYIEPNMKIAVIDGTTSSQKVTVYLNRIDENGVFYLSVDPDTANIQSFNMTIQAPYFAWCYEIDDDVLSDNIARTTDVSEQINTAIQNSLPKTATVTMLATNWTGDANPWYQTVEVNGVTENSKLDPQPTAVQIVNLQDAEITLMLQNDGGTVTAFAIGNKPTEDYEMQVLITETISL